MQGGTAAVEQVIREEYGRLIASLVRRFGDIDIAEEAAGEAFVAALEKWPESGVPPSPGGWLTTIAGNRAIDRIRREKQRDAKHRAAFMYLDDAPINVGSVSSHVVATPAARSWWSGTTTRTGRVERRGRSDDAHEAWSHAGHSG